MATNGRQELLQLTIRGIVSMGALGGATFLAAKGTIESEAVVVLYTTVIALWGVGVSQPRPNASGGGP